MISENLDIMSKIEFLADTAQDSSNIEASKQAQHHLQSIAESPDITNEQLLEYIGASNHMNSLYYVLNAFATRIAQGRHDFDANSAYMCWSSLLALAKQDNRFQFTIREQLLKTAVIVLHVNFFNQLVIENEQLGPFFSYLESAVQNKDEPEFILHLLDEIIFQCRGKWRVPSGIAWDFQHRVQRSLETLLLSHFVKCALYLVEEPLTNKVNIDEKLKLLYSRFCELISQAVYDIEEDKNRQVYGDMYYRPPENFNGLMLPLVQTVFQLQAQVQAFPDIMYQSFEILIRLCYASGPVFSGGAANFKSKYMAYYTKQTSGILQNVNLYDEYTLQILLLLKHLTHTLYSDKSFDRSIYNLAKNLSDAMKILIPLVIKKIIEDDEGNGQQLANLLFQPMRNVSLCLDDHQESNSYFYHIASNILTTLRNYNWNFTDDDARKNCTLLVSGIVDIAILNFLEFSTDILKATFEISKNLELADASTLSTYPWICYIIGEILARKFMFHSDKLYLDNILKEQHLNGISSNSADYIEAYSRAFGFQSNDEMKLNFVGGFAAAMITVLRKAKTLLRHQDPQLQSCNANFLSSIFYSFKHVIRITADPSIKPESPDCEILPITDEPKPHMIEVSSEYCQLFVKETVVTIFEMVSLYRNHKHLIDDALSCLDTMADCGYFVHYMAFFMSFISQDMTDFPDRRRLFFIAAKAAAESVDPGCTSQHFMTAALNPYIARISSLSQEINSQNMIMCLEIFTGFADVLVQYPFPLYGSMVYDLFVQLSNLYPIYKHDKAVVDKFLEFFTVAVPRIIYLNIDIGGEAVANTAKLIIGFMHVYCSHNEEKWNLIDANNLGNEGYDDLILLMKIVKDALDRLAIESSEDDDEETHMAIINDISILCLHTFIPLCTNYRVAIPEVLNAFSDMLNSVAEFNVSALLNFVQDREHPLFRVMYHTMDFNLSNAVLCRSLTTLTYIFEKYNIVYTMLIWRDFARLLADRIFGLALISFNDYDIFRLCKECLYFMIAGDKDYFTYYFAAVTAKQRPEYQTVAKQAFANLCDIELTREGRGKFDDNFRKFLSETSGYLVYTPGDIDMALLIQSYGN